MAEKKIKVTQYETNDPKYNIKISVIYSKGGRDSLTGDYIEPAYYCHVDRVEINTLSSLKYETLAMGAGTAFELEPAKKFSQKKLEFLASEVSDSIAYSASSFQMKRRTNHKPKIDQCINHLLNKFKLTLGDPCPKSEG